MSGKTAVMFPGQGAQFPGMGKDFYDRSQAAKAVFDSFEKKRKGTLKQCFESSPEELALTINTQPCVLAVELAIAAALKEKGVIADYTCGFSLGELAALYYSGMLTLEEVIDFVIFRAQQMDMCTKKSAGTMAAVLKLDADIVSGVCRQYEKACIANYNNDTQVTVSCAAADYERIEAELKSLGGMVIKLNVSGAFHSSFMDTAAENVAVYLEKVMLKDALIPCFSNVTAEFLNDKALIAKQINHPVKWNQILDKLLQNGVNRFIETGPGNVLTGLIKRKTKTVEALTVSNWESLESL